jgi:hypothetical protein
MSGTKRKIKVLEVDHRMAVRDPSPALREVSRMMRIASPVAGRFVGFSLAAVAVLMLVAVPGKPAQAMSQITPSVARRRNMPLTL